MPRPLADQIELQLVWRAGLAMIDIMDGKRILRERLSPMTHEALQAMTGTILHPGGPVADHSVPEL